MDFDQNVACYLTMGHEWVVMDFSSVSSCACVTMGQAVPADYEKDYRVDFSFIKYF